MSDLRRVGIIDQDGSLTFVVRPNRNRLLTLLMGGWIAGVLMIGGGGAYVLYVGQFHNFVWALFSLAFGSMVAGGACAIWWNERFTKVITLSSNALTIETGGIRSRRRLSLDRVSGFRIVGPPWPYTVSAGADYEFLGLGVWGVEAHGPGGATARMITRVNRDAASVVATMLREKGYRVDVPFQINGSSAVTGVGSANDSPIARG